MIIVSHRNSSRKNVLICFSSSVIITVSYSATTYTASERIGTVQLTLLVVGPPTGGAPHSFTLVANTEDGTASRFCDIQPQQYNNNILDFVRSK